MTLGWQSTAAVAQEYLFLGGNDWDEALGTGHVVPMEPFEWDNYMAQWQQFHEGEPYPENVFIAAMPPNGELYTWPGGDDPDYPHAPGLVMAWTPTEPFANCCQCRNFDPPEGACVDGPIDPIECEQMGAGWDECTYHPSAACIGNDCVPIRGVPTSYSSAWKYVLGGPGSRVITNLTNTVISVTVNAPQFDQNGNQINAVSLGIQDVNGLVLSAFWTVGPGQPIQWSTLTTLTINVVSSTNITTNPPASGWVIAPGVDITQSQFILVDENGNWIGGPTPIPPPGMVTGIWNYWYNLSIAPGPGGPGGGGNPTHGPVSFSVDGFNQNTPSFDGLPIPGSPYFNPPWQPAPPPGMGPYGLIRAQPKPQATGIATARIGDVNDYWVFGKPSEAEIFQSEPDLGPAGPPAGTNNQIVQATALGLNHGDANVNAYTFGEDYFNDHPDPIGSGEVWGEVWEGRAQAGGFIEPVVTTGGLPITFYFSVDPWAIGLPNTSVQNEATWQGALTLPPGPPGSADQGVFTAPWTSDGEAAGDVFYADPITAPMVNFLDHDEALMALLAPRMAGVITNQEDDLDALDHVGTNAAGESGNTHDRVAPTSGVNGGLHPPDLGDPNNANHDPNNDFPLIFSVDRGSWGAAGSAVLAQVNNPNDGASGDLFIAVTIPWGMWQGQTTNMLLIDDGQLGLMPHDDLDAVILKILIDPMDLQARIDEATQFFNPDSVDGSEGFGFTLPLLNGGEALVGFSVDVGSIGLLNTAVDFECRVDGLGLVGPGFAGSGIVEHPGDIFYTDLVPPPGQAAADLGTGLLFGQNYLWFEERMIGLDPGTWTFIMPPGPSGNLADPADELNALDSLGDEGEPYDPDTVVCEPQGGNNPIHPPTYWYDVTNNPNHGICDFHVEVFDPNIGNYSAVVLPPGNWQFTVHTVDGVTWWASWWSPGCLNPIWSTFRFQFDNQNPSAWANWRTTYGAVSDPDTPDIWDRSENHASEADGYGYRVHAPVYTAQPEACCLQDGTCVTVMASTCIAMGGTPQGAGTACQAATVACCLQDGSCVDVDPLCCDDLGGTVATSPFCLGDMNGDGNDDACVPYDPDTVVCEPQGGNNPIHPPTYWYDVTNNPNHGICDFHVEVFDSNASNYTSVVSPPGWAFLVHTVDGVTWWASWWSPGCMNPIWSTFRFQFDNQNPSVWGNWRTTYGAVSDPDTPFQWDRSENHSTEPDGLGYRVHTPVYTPEPEACCLPDGACIMVLDIDCMAMGGTPQGPGTMCGPIEACCLQDGTCMMVDALCCDDMGGSAQGPGSQCTTTEACCLPDGTCTDVDPLCCDDMGGIPQGLGTACSPTTVACCLPGGACIDVDPLCCDDFGGTIGFAPFCLGDTNGNQIDDACEEPEACCLPDGTCIMALVHDCFNMGGIPHGPGSQCTQPESCCLPDGTCLETDPLCCDDIGGTPGYTLHCLGDLNGNQVDDACEPPIGVARPLPDPAFDIQGTVRLCQTDADCRAGLNPDTQAYCIPAPLGPGGPGTCYVARNRYVCIDPNPENAGLLTARRVSLDLGGGATQVLGWIGEPVALTIAGPEVSPQLLSRLVGAAHYRDWWLDSTINLGDCETSPAHRYLIQAIPMGADPSDDANYSEALALPTVLDWADVVGSSIGQPPDRVRSFKDISAVVRGFQSIQTEPKTWLDLQGGTATPALPDFSDINFADINWAVKGFQGGAYPFAAPLDCP